MRARIMALRPIIRDHTSIAQQFFVFGYYGWKNTGDDAMLYTILRELHTLYPKNRIVVVARVPAKVPEETKSLVKFVKPVPHTVFREILNSSVFIIGGGTHIEDFGTRKIRPLKNVLRIFIFTVLAKFLGKEICFLDIGIGPISTVWDRLLLKPICELSDFISVRDRSSYEILKNLGVDAKSRLSFDASVLLEPLSNRDITVASGANNNKILGLSVSPVSEIYDCNRKKDIMLAREIAKGLNQWMEEDLGVEVHLFIFKGESKDDDVAFTNLLQGRLKLVERVKLVPYESDPRKRLSQVSRCDYFIGMRFHSSLFAYLTGIPMLMIDYHPKCRALAEYIGLPKHAIVSPNEILTGQFRHFLEHFRESPNSFRATLPIDVAKWRARCGLCVHCRDSAYCTRSNASI